MKGTFPIDKFRELRTPFYYYDTKVLRETLSCIRTEASRYDNYSVHYAVKANANPKVLTIIRESGLGADCVSGGEIRAAIKAGFPADKIVFAGVGKADWEINLGLDYNIFCFNVESIPELEIINELAVAKGKVANVAFRINPNVGAHTHANITTGLAENKFGISMEDMDHVIDVAQEMKTSSSSGCISISVRRYWIWAILWLCVIVSTNCWTNSKPVRYVSNTLMWAVDSALITDIPTVSLYPISKAISKPTITA